MQASGVASCTDWHWVALKCTYKLTALQQWVLHHFSQSYLVFTARHVVIIFLGDKIDGYQIWSLQASGKPASFSLCPQGNLCDDGHSVTSSQNVKQAQNTRLLRSPECCCLLDPSIASCSVRRATRVRRPVDCCTTTPPV